MNTRPVSILVTGAQGQLGRELKLLSGNTTHAWIFTDIGELDIADEPQVKRMFSNEAFDFCINCAAYTAVDRAEQDRDMAFRINARGPAVLAGVSARHDCVLLHVSTDFVFDGRGNLPIREDHPVVPLSVYGQSKAEGEEEVLRSNPRSLILRTAWLYSVFGHNFFKTILRLGAERDQLNVVCDQIGSPTYARDLAVAILKIIAVLNNDSARPDSPFGIYHFSHEGVASWYDFAVEIAALAGLKATVSPILTGDYPLPAPRPVYSVLDKTRIKNQFGVHIDHWRQALIRCWSDYRAESPHS
jgi:dTDP-4-dehydrorhamnose reductase